MDPEINHPVAQYSSTPLTESEPIKPTIPNPTLNQVLSHQKTLSDHQNFPFHTQSSLSDPPPITTREI